MIKPYYLIITPLFRVITITLSLMTSRLLRTPNFVEFTSFHHKLTAFTNCITHMTVKLNLRLQYVIITAQFKLKLWSSITFKVFTLQQFREWILIAWHNLIMLPRAFHYIIKTLILMIFLVTHLFCRNSIF